MGSRGLLGDLVDDRLPDKGSVARGLFLGGRYPGAEFLLGALLFLVFDWNKLHILWLLPLIIFGAPFIALGGIPGVSQLVMAMTRLFVPVILIGIPRRDHDEPPPDLLDETGSFRPRDQLTPEQQRRADEYWERQTEKLRRMKG